MKLENLLIRPLVILDLETTGINIIEDRIVEISIMKLNLDGTRDLKTRRVNPGIAIKPEAINTHGITQEMVMNEPSFNSLAKSIYQFISGCDIATFNGNNFDLPMLAREFKRADIDFNIIDINVIDVRNIYTLQYPKTLSAAYKEYTGNDLTGAHAADNDVIATLDILEKQITSQTDVNMPNKIEEIATYSNFGSARVDIEGWLKYDQTGTKYLFARGKHVNTEINKVPLDYLNWLCYKSNPAPLSDVSNILKGVINKANNIFNT